MCVCARVSERARKMKDLTQHKNKNKQTKMLLLSLLLFVLFLLSYIFGEGVGERWREGENIPGIGPGSLPPPTGSTSLE